MASLACSTPRLLARSTSKQQVVLSMRFFEKSKYISPSSGVANFTLENQKQKIKYVQIYK